MTIAEILKGMETVRISGRKEINVAGVSYDSRNVKGGEVFVAVRGGKQDGRSFIPDAVKKGAVAVIFDKSDPALDHLSGDAVLIEVKNARKALAFAADNFFRSPSRSLCVTGITGTNGKTTTSYIVKSILETWGKKVGLIGTIQYLIGDEAFNAPHTTPEAPEFQELLYKMLHSGCSHVVSEISSHALVQERVDRTIFRGAVFTNLTRDHLDFHETMENYFLAKMRLFSELLDETGVAVINSDDPYGQKLLSSVRHKRRSGSVLGYGLGTSSELMAADIKDSPEGLRFRIKHEGKGYDVVSPLLGLPNVYNILSAAGLAAALGVPWDSILSGISGSGPVRGRFEKVNLGQPFLAVVDYAHTEDALERLIYTARGMGAGKVITVFGCGGDRDKGKRPRMGELATKLSDFVVITSDNPRTEKPEEIIRDIVAGAVRKNFLIEADRKEAIKRAVLLAEAGDILLVAGKGHEDYQDTGIERVTFKDREVLEEAIKELRRDIRKGRFI